MGPCWGACRRTFALRTLTRHVVRLSCAREARACCEVKRLGGGPAPGAFRTHGRTRLRNRGRRRRPATLACRLGRTQTHRHTRHPPASPVMLPHAPACTTPHARPRTYLDHVTVLVAWSRGTHEATRSQRGVRGMWGMLLPECLQTHANRHHPAPHCKTRIAELHTHSTSTKTIW